MVHLRLVVPPDLLDAVVGILRATRSVYNIVQLPGVASRPAGDLVLCDVAREDASVVLDELKRIGLHERGSIATETIDTALSREAARAEQVALGSPADAVVWEEVEARTSESTELSASYLAFMVLATLIAAAGIITDSIILIIGAMVVGPEFGPLAGVCVAVVRGQVQFALRSATALVAGFALAIAASVVGTLLLRATDQAPDSLAEHPETFFISDPNIYSAIVAVLAGVAGMLSLTTAKSGALIGVLISVTTIPAAANVGVAAAYGNWSEFGGALSQLGINLASIVAAGVVTLALERVQFVRRRARLRSRAARR